MINALRRPSRYAQIGVLCALLSNALIIGLDALKVHYLPATVLATLAVTVAGYLMHCAYTFRVAPTLSSLLRFAGGTAVGSCLAIMMMVVLCSGLGLSASAAIPIATLLMFGWNYAMANWAIARVRTTAVSPDTFRD